MGKGIRFGINLIVLTILSMGVSNAQLHIPRAALDSNRILLGDQINLNIELLKTKKSKVIFPEFLDTLVKGVEILKKSNIDTIEVNNDLERLQMNLLITSFDSGYYEIKPLLFEIEEDGISNSFYTRPQYLQVLTLSLDSGENAIFDIKPPVPMPVKFMEVAPWIGIGLAAAALIAFLIYFFKRRQQNKPVFRREKPKEPAHVIAFRNLDNLGEQKLWQNNLVKQYYSDLTEIFRVYLEDKFGISAMEETSYEILEEVKHLSLEDEKLISKITEMLLNADLVKFAKGNPIAEENEQSFKIVYDFVEKTKEILSEVEQKALEEEILVEVTQSIEESSQDVPEVEPEENSSQINLKED